MYFSWSGLRALRCRAPQREVACDIFCLLRREEAIDGGAQRSDHRRPDGHREPSEDEQDERARSAGASGHRESSEKTDGDRHEHRHGHAIQFSRSVPPLLDRPHRRVVQQRLRPEHFHASTLPVTSRMRLQDHPTFLPREPRDIGIERRHMDDLARLADHPTGRVRAHLVAPLASAGAAGAVADAVLDQQ